MYECWFKVNNKDPRTTSIEQIYACLVQNSSLDFSKLKVQDNKVKEGEHIFTDNNNFAILCAFSFEEILKKDPQKKSIGYSLIANFKLVFS